MKRRSLFTTLAGLFFAKKAAAAPKPVTRIRRQAIIEGPPPFDRAFHELPIAVFIGTGRIPFVDMDNFKDVTFVRKDASEGSCIAAMIGRKGTIEVHLYGEWETMLRREKLFAVWQNLTCNRVAPRLFIDGEEMLILGSPRFIIPAHYLRDAGWKTFQQEYAQGGYITLHPDYESILTK